MFKVNNLKKTSSLVVFLAGFIYFLFASQLVWAEGSSNIMQLIDKGVKESISVKCTSTVNLFDYSEPEIYMPCVASRYKEQPARPLLSTLSPNGKRLYTLYKTKLFVFQVSPFKHISTHDFPYDEKLRTNYSVFVTSNEEYLIFTTHNKIVQYDLSTHKVSNSMDVGFGQWVIDSVLNGEELVLLSSNTSSPYHHRNSAYAHPGNLLIYDTFSLKRKRKLELDLGDDTHILYMDRLNKVDDTIFLSKSNNCNISRCASLTLFDTNTYKPKITFISSGDKFSFDRKELYLNVSKIIKLSDGRKTEFIPDKSLIRFDLKTGEISYNFSSRKMRKAPFVAASQFSQGGEYIVHGAARIENLETGQKYLLKQYKNNQAILLEIGLKGSFEAVGQVRPYLFMKKANRQITPMNDATFNRFNKDSTN